MKDEKQDIGSNLNHLTFVRGFLFDFARHSKRVHLSYNFCCYVSALRVFLSDLTIVAVKQKVLFITVYPSCRTESREVIIICNLDQICV